MAASIPEEDRLHMLELTAQAYMHSWEARSSAVDLRTGWGLRQRARATDRLLPVSGSSIEETRCASREARRRPKDLGGLWGRLGQNM